MCVENNSRQTRPVCAVQLLVSLATVKCGISLLFEWSVLRRSKHRLRERLRLCADNAFIVRWLTMIGLIPGMYKRFQIEVDGHCYSHPIWLHHPLSGHYNPSLIWYKNFPVIKANKDWQWELGRTFQPWCAIRWSAAVETRLLTT